MLVMLIVVEETIKQCTNYHLHLTTIWNNYLENCPWANTKPSSRIGNLTSQLPTMFWILNSVNFACENTTKPVLFNKKITGPSLRVVTYLPVTPVCLMGPWCCLDVVLNLSVIVSFNHKATSVLQVWFWFYLWLDKK